MKTQRIQRRRAKGWKLPPDTICVDRSTLWGNPFIVDRDGTRAQCVEQHRLLLGGYFCLTAKASIEDQRNALNYAVANIHRLKGKNLACWCPLPKPGQADLCHGATLLEAARKKHPVRKVKKNGN